MSDKQQRIVSALMDRHGRTFAAELGVDLKRNTPSPLFRLLCFSLLTSAPVQADIAMRGAIALGRAGWTTPQKLAESRWSERARTLNNAGYARVDEKTATQLDEMNRQLLEEYGGDLRKLREHADGDVQQVQKALKRFKGIGDTGAGIFLREVQGVWQEFYPFADKAALKAAEKLELPASADRLARLVDQQDYPCLVAALVRAQLAKDTDAIRKVTSS
ncbi:hypothetical protein [Kushneria phosphatilytica]|uniref:Uncharacterized protein n=1 Tax=Kushneria phosphatilytica TaxID=657387 RepID=A0A1S1NRH6_9GAMM|nr:hypothetical protein [Kushneria phosphatilytica]OHV07520.1 hypothetical protein BH688_14915 [Kushneria phosphatilytica]QEL10003.1 hypothetical protein FY550_01870 [Kushneria phosphatilytica]